MIATGTQAILPKARSMFSKRITLAEYEEMMRRRTVPELSLLLRRHPYFRGSLASLSPTDPHRGQIEELLAEDIFKKYEALLTYVNEAENFTAYYLGECEIAQILRALHLISVGQQRMFLEVIPPYLIGKARFDLYELAKANTVAEVAEVLRRTFFYGTVLEIVQRDPDMTDFPMAEAAILRYHYSRIFAQIEESFSGREAEGVRNLFLMEAQIYNFQLLLRLKTYFPDAYTPEEIRRLLLPYTYRTPRRLMEELIEAPGTDRLIALLRASPLGKYATGGTPDELAVAGNMLLYRHSKLILHLNPSPYAALAAFITLSKLERENIITVVEGVRYKLAPEQIRAMLWL